MNHSKVEFGSDTPRERYLTVARIGDKLSRKKSWIYKKLAADPTFPHPLRLGAFPVWAESAIDAWVKAVTANPTTPSNVLRLRKRAAAALGRGKKAGAR